MLNDLPGYKEITPIEKYSFGPRQSRGNFSSKNPPYNSAKSANFHYLISLPPSSQFRNNVCTCPPCLPLRSSLSRYLHFEVFVTIQAINGRCSMPMVTNRTPDFT
jgi:hypothetical protein